MTTPAMQPTPAQSSQVAGMTPPKIGTPLIAVTIVLCFVTGVLGGCLSLLGMFSLMGADGCSTSTDPRQCETAVNIAAAIAVVTPAVVSIAAIVMAIVGLSRRNRRAWIYVAGALPILLLVFPLVSLVYRTLAPA